MGAGRAAGAEPHFQRQALSLDDNGLTAVPDCVGSGGLDRLRTLSLRRNRIQTLAPEVRT